VGPTPISADEASRRQLLWERLLALLCAGYPAIFLACFANLILSARLALGHWPRPYLDDPKFISAFVNLHAHLVAVLLVAWPAALLGTLLFGGVQLRRSGWRRVVPWGLASLLLWVVFFTVPRWDPGRFFEWFMD
jgi:hypothetical protein